MMFPRPFPVTTSLSKSTASVSLQTISRTKPWARPPTSGSFLSPIAHCSSSLWHMYYCRYFDFHPVPEAEGVSSKTHGVTPVWGFGTVIKSTHPRVHAGERVYGYFAPARYLLLPVSPGVNKYAFFVPRPHLPPGDWL